MTTTNAERRGRPRHAGPERRVRAAISTERATAGLVVGRLTVAPAHVVFVKGVVEASDGLASLFADRGGELSIASPTDRAAELRELLHDLAAELGGTVRFGADPHDAPARATTCDLSRAATGGGSSELGPEMIDAPRTQGAPHPAASPR